MHNKNAVQRRSYAEFLQNFAGVPSMLSPCVEPYALRPSVHAALSWKAKGQRIARLRRCAACIAHLGSDGPFKLLSQGVLTWECPKKFGVLLCWFGHCLLGTFRKTFGTARSQVGSYENCHIIHSERPQILHNCRVSHKKAPQFLSKIQAAG